MWYHCELDGNNSPSVECYVEGKSRKDVRAYVEDNLIGDSVTLTPVDFSIIEIKQKLNRTHGPNYAFKLVDKRSEEREKIVGDNT